MTALYSHDYGTFGPSGKRVQIEHFGHRHWQMLIVALTASMDSERLDIRQLGLSKNRAHLFNAGHVCDVTILKNGLVIKDHDDWDCLEDLEAADLIELGTLTNPTVEVTQYGCLVYERLCMHKIFEKDYSTFQPALTNLVVLA